MRKILKSNCLSKIKGGVSCKRKVLRVMLEKLHASENKTKIFLTFSENYWRVREMPFCGYLLPINRLPMNIFLILLWAFKGVKHATSIPFFTRTF